MGETEKHFMTDKNCPKYHFVQREKFLFRMKCGIIIFLPEFPLGGNKPFSLTFS